MEVDGQTSPGEPSSLSLLEGERNVLEGAGVIRRKRSEEVETEL